MTAIVLTLSYYWAFIILGVVLTKFITKDYFLGFFLSFLATFFIGLFGTAATLRSLCGSPNGDLPSECLQAIPFEYYFIPVGVLLGHALIIFLFGRTRSISLFFTDTALAMGNFFRRHQERFLKSREEKRVVSNAETIFRNQKVSQATLAVIKRALSDRKESLEKIPMLIKRLVALRKHRIEVEKSIKIASEQAKKQDVDAANGCYFATLLEDMDIELHETIDAILNTEKEIAWCQKCLNEARSFLAVVPGEKEYYEKANELASKVLKEEERLKKELTS